MKSAQLESKVLNPQPLLVRRNAVVISLKDLHGHRSARRSDHRDMSAKVLKEHIVIDWYATRDGRVQRVAGDREQAVELFHRRIIPHRALVIIFFVRFQTLSRA